MRIDSHQHFWKYDSVRDSWIDDSMKVIRRNFLPEDLKPVLDKNNIEGSVVIQADQSEKETQFLLDLADKNHFIYGVVGWVDLKADNVEERLNHFNKNILFKGIRHIVQAEPDDFMLDLSFQHGISKLKNYNLTYDILVYPSQLPAAIKLAEKFPDQKFVLDHIAKPNIKERQIKGWQEQISELAKYSNVFCKVSGMLTEADWKNWDKSDFKPYLDVVFKAFGTQRILYGSDWPVSLLAGKYKEQMEVLENYISQFSNQEKALIMGANASKFYNLKS